MVLRLSGTDKPTLPHPRGAEPKQQAKGHHQCEDQGAGAKRRVARRLNSHALVADSRQTDLCAYLSGILFVGLILNALFGWWWADSIAAILMIPIITREGVEALKGNACDACR